MTSDEFKAGLKFLWGEGWRKIAPQAFDVTPSSLDRWANGHVDLPGPAGRLMEKLLEEEAARRTQRGYERTYKKAKRAKRGEDHG